MSDKELFNEAGSPHNIRRVLWVGFNFVLGAAGGGMLAFGPLAANQPVIITFAFGGAFLQGWPWVMWYRAILSRQNKAAVRWRKSMVPCQLVILFFVVSATLVPLYKVGIFPPPSENRVANFERLWQAMDRYYPYFLLKEVDSNEIYKRYRPIVEEVESNTAYLDLVSEMLAELQDGHTGVIRPSASATRNYFGTARKVEGVIVADLLGPTARKAGIERGDIILELNGMTVGEALTALPPSLRAGSSLWSSLEIAVFHLLSTEGDSLDVTYETAEGNVHTVSLVRPEYLPDEQPEQEWAPLIESILLPEGFGLIRVPTFGGGTGHNLVNEFDAALSKLIQAPGIIIDLRGNGGGSTFISDRIAGRFFTEPFSYGRDYFEGRLPQRGGVLTFMRILLALFLSTSSIMIVAPDKSIVSPLLGIYPSKRKIKRPRVSRFS
jgi:hypothetical protein